MCNEENDPCTKKNACISSLLSHNCQKPELGWVLRFCNWPLNQRTGSQSKTKKQTKKNLRLEHLRVEQEILLLLFKWGKIIPWIVQYCHLVDLYYYSAMLLACIVGVFSVKNIYILPITNLEILVRAVNI